jgi:serine/threonine-protein kinase HipA
MPAQTIYVYAGWQTENPQIGTLTSELLRGKEIFSFEYDPDWLHNRQIMSLDPDLQLFTGRQFIRGEKPNFGMFMDSSPDRWGKVLMKRREALLARQEERKARNLLESDFLLGVYDPNRMGGLRFKTQAGGPFLNNEAEMAAPPWVRLRELEQASLHLEREDIKNDNQELHWLNMLMAPGASLGGARPKASVTDPDGNLWIAKFPSVNDTTDTGAWEMVTHQLENGRHYRPFRRSAKIQQTPPYLSYQTL